MKKLNKLSDLSKYINDDMIAKKVGKQYSDNLDSELNKFKESGSLMKSFKMLLQNNRIVFKSNLDYAEIQDKGGKIRVTDKMRAKMWALYKETKQSIYKNIALTKQSFITIKANNYSDKAWERTIKKIKL